MNKILLHIFLVFSFTSLSLAQQQSVPIGTDEQLSCLLTRASDQYGYFSASILQKLSGDSYLSVRFDTRITRIEARINNLREEIQGLRSYNQSRQIILRRAEIRELKTKLTEVQLCRAQKDQFYFDIGLGRGADACEVASGQQNFVAKIINGEECSRLNSPIVNLTLRDQRGDYYSCTGTVVNSRSVITAAHCITGITEIIVETGIGAVPAVSFDHHPDYDGTETNDLGIVIVGQDLDVLAFPVISKYRTMALGERVIFAGYGVSEIGSETANGNLLAGANTLTRVSRERLSIDFNSIEQSNTCFGDSGGPLLSYQNSRWVLAGVTSNGRRADCGYEDQSNFANLLNASNRNYIKSRISDVVD